LGPLEQKLIISVLPFCCEASNICAPFLKAERNQGNAVPLWRGTKTTTQREKTKNDRQKWSHRPQDKARESHFEPKPDKTTEMEPQTAGQSQGIALRAQTEIPNRSPTYDSTQQRTTQD